MLLGVRETPLIELQLWAISHRGCRWLIDVGPYESCRVAGIIQRLRLDPVEGYVEATVIDGTGSMVARWPLHRPTPQLVALRRRGVVLEGVTTPTEDGRLVLEEPSFEFIPYPPQEESE